MRHNNQLPNGHFHKDWARRVKTWFNQPGKKESRRIARSKKAATLAPRPVDGLLRPAVHCPTVRYNVKVRVGRGFSLDELKEAKITKKVARTIGIAVDHRRRNKSLESLQLNVARLTAYKQRLIVFPKNAKKPGKTDSPAEALAGAQQLGAGLLMPVAPLAAKEAPRAITAAEKEFKAYTTLRKQHSDARLIGKRNARAKAKAEAEEAK